MCLQAALVILLMLASTVKTQDGGVEFWRNTVTLTCPGSGTWHDSQKEIHKGKTYQIGYKQKLKYKCVYQEAQANILNEKTYLFYVKGKVCENCFEVDAFVVMLIIIVDVIGTAAVMMMIFRYGKKRSSYALTHSSKPPPPPGRGAPNGPQPAYEELPRRS